ncbi:hypothetical protein GGR26_003438 [Lewinella marina]|uniref:Uncharacterized protein n=1 Tax=Neolewinella marina TaxID=438751 RepID=A0A2G0CCI4_9BACT|nr:hypothetical protein [Neolewinella marina]NJB87654.1 hypothetical protein [Neolewinella marina]PHK97662.1 hypothetical protein CGL56_14620 [Neolewinella marina]
MVPRNDHIWIGLAVSFVVSFVAYGLFLQLGEWLTAGAGREITFRPRTLALMAICLNVLPMNVFRRTYRTRSLKGLVIGVMILAAAWFFYYGRELLNG